MAVAILSPVGMTICCALPATHMGETPCDGIFSCPICSVWDQDCQLHLTQCPAKKHKSCSFTSASPPPPSEVNLEPVEFVGQPSYSSVQPTPLTLFSHPTEMSNVLANINTSLLHISSMLGSRGQRSGSPSLRLPWLFVGSRYWDT